MPSAHELLPTSASDPVVQSLLTHDKWLVPYLLGWAGLAEPQPWGAAMSFALECAAGKGLIRGESDATLTQKGRQVAAIIRPMESASPDAVGVPADLRQGVSQAAGVTLDELDLMDSATDPDVLAQQAQAELATVAGMQNPAAKAGRLCLAAARLIAAAPELAEALRAQDEAEQYRNDLFALASDGTRLTQQHTDRAEELFEKARQLRRAALIKAGLQ